MREFNNHVMITYIINAQQINLNWQDWAQNCDFKGLKVLVIQLPKIKKKTDKKNDDFQSKNYEMRKYLSVRLIFNVKKRIKKLV